jgi:RNA polymerase sigma-70 factor (ECF subfamily)
MPTLLLTDKFLMSRTSNGMDNEENLIKQCQSGETDKFGLLYDDYVQKIYRYVFYRTHHKETAEDITGTVFVKALENINSFDASRASFSAWIYRIARNTVIDHFRTTKINVNIEDVLEMGINDNTQDDIDIRQKIKRVQEYMKQLDPDQREILILRVWEGLSYSEIAHIVGKKEINLRVIFSRTLKKIKKDIGPLAILLIMTTKM